MSCARAPGAGGVTTGEVLERFLDDWDAERNASISSCASLTPPGRGRKWPVGGTRIVALTTAKGPGRGHGVLAAVSMATGATVICTTSIERAPRRTILSIFVLALHHRVVVFRVSGKWEIGDGKEDELSILKREDVKLMLEKKFTSP